MSYATDTINVKFIQQNTMINSVECLLEIEKNPKSYDEMLCTLYWI